MHPQEQNTNEVSIMDSNYNSQTVPYFDGTPVVASRACNPYNSKLLDDVLILLYNRLDLSKGKHRVLDMNTFVNGFKHLVSLAIEGNGQVNSAYHDLCDESNVCVPSQIQWVLSRCTTHVGENTRVSFDLTKEGKESLGDVDVAKGEVEKLFGKLAILRDDDRIPYRVAETLPFSKTIKADESSFCWLEESKGKKSVVMSPYSKVRPESAVLAAMLNAGTVAKLDNTIYKCIVDTVDNMLGSLT